MKIIKNTILFPYMRSKINKKIQRKKTYNQKQIKITCNYIKINY